MHGVAQFDIASGAQKKAVVGTPTYTSVFSNTLCELARQDPTVVGITAAMPGGTGLDHFGKVLICVNVYTYTYTYMYTHTHTHTHPHTHTLMIHMLCVMSGTGLDHFGKVLLRDMVSLYVCMFSMYVCTHTRVHTHTDIYTLSHHCVLWRAVRVCARA